MKKAIAAQLNKIAQELPSFKIRSKQPVRYAGEFLLSVNTFEVNGKPVSPESSYLIYPLADVNHVVNLKDIYKKEGMKGVNEYCDKIREHFANNKN